jgi:hypothetical protein
MEEEVPSGFKIVVVLPSALVVVAVPSAVVLVVLPSG